MSARALRALVTVVLKQFPWVESPVDLLILLEVGCHQEAGSPLAMKGLLLAGIGAPSTVTRRLARLVERKFIIKRRGSSDGRSIRLVLTAGTWRRVNGAYLAVARLVAEEERRQTSRR